MISAVIRTFNSAQTLTQTLDSLAAQHRQVDEVVIVDSGSTDSTLEIVRRFGHRVLHYPQERPFNYSLSLNLGIKASRGERVLILSSHCVLEYPDAVQFMCANLDVRPASGVYCMPGTADEVLANRDDPLRGQLIKVIYGDNYNGSNGLWNCCAMINRDAWKDHPFDETLPACEDQEWALWHYRRSRLPTIAIRNAGVRYLNPNWTFQKDIREKVIVATRVWPPARQCRAIVNIIVDGIFALWDRRLRTAQNHFKLAWALTASHFQGRT